MSEIEKEAYEARIESQKQMLEKAGEFGDHAGEAKKRLAAEQAAREEAQHIRK